MKFYSILKNKIVIREISKMIFDIYINWWCMLISHNKWWMSAVSSCLIVKWNHSWCECWKLCYIISRAVSVHNNIMKLIKSLNYDIWYFFNFSYKWWSRKSLFRNMLYNILKKSTNECWNSWVCRVFKALKMKWNFEWVTE